VSDSAADRLSPILGHRFSRPELLIEALTHASAVPRSRDRGRGGAAQGYERLEFLGDRVLGLVVAEWLWRRFPDEAEGALTRRHTQLVRRETLAEVARGIGLSPVIIMSAGEDSARTRESAGILADVCEAVIAALYLDGGLEAAARFIHRQWERLIEADPTPPRDPKTALQEWVQARGRVLPRYETVRVEGPAHERRFTVSVTVAGMTPEAAAGSSKRAAEVAAAAALLQRIAAGQGAEGETPGGERPAGGRPVGGRRRGE
jgi:ribonuclease-3